MADTASHLSKPDRRGERLARFLAAASGADSVAVTAMTPLSGRRDPGELGPRRRFLGRQVRRKAAARIARRGGDRGAVEPRPTAGIRRIAGRVRSRRDGAGTALRLRRRRRVRQAVLCHAAGLGKCCGTPHHPRPGTRSRTAGYRRTARAGTCAPPSDPAAAPRPRLSDSLCRGRADGADRHVPRLSRSSSGTPPGARMGHPLARNPSAAAGRAGSVPSRFPHRQLPPRRSRADRHPRLGIRRVGRSARGHRLVLLQGLALCPARPRGRRDCRPRAVLSRLRDAIRAAPSIPAASSSGRFWRACAGR